MLNVVHWGRQPGLRPEGNADVAAKHRHENIALQDFRIVVDQIAWEPTVG